MVRKGLTEGMALSFVWMLVIFCAAYFIDKDGGIDFGGFVTLMLFMAMPSLWMVLEIYESGRKTSYNQVIEALRILAADEEASLRNAGRQEAFDIAERVGVKIWGGVGV